MTTSPPRHPDGANALHMTLRVPGSTSNLGPGFDLLGLALDLFVELRVRAGHVPPGTCAIEGDDPFFLTCFAPVLERALMRGLALGGAEPVGLEVRVTSEVPAARGLGSSGAVAAGGVLLGAALAPHAGGAPVERARIVAAAVELDGHPDNAVASLFGGCTLALRTGAATDPTPWRVVEHPLHPDLAFALAWPTEPLPTPRARRVLPEQVPFADAVDQPRRLAALLEGLRTADPELLAHGLVDHLHETVRLPLIPGAEPALEAARAAGAHGATLSGSGSALVAVAPVADAARAADAMARVLGEHGEVGGRRVARPVLGTPEPHPGFWA